MNITDFIETNYDIIWRHPESIGEEEIDTYLIAEKHKCPPVQRVNELFISTFANPGSVLLIEGQASLHKVSAAIMHPHNMTLDTPHIVHGSIFGWDDATCSEDISDELWDWVFFCLKSKYMASEIAHINWGEELLSYASIINKEDDFDEPTRIQKAQQFEQAMDKVIPPVETFISTYMLPLAIALKEEDRQMEEAKIALEQSRSREKELFLRQDWTKQDWDDLHECISQNSAYSNRYTEGFSKIDEIKKEIEGKIKCLGTWRTLEHQKELNKGFPQRTSAMVETLHHVRKYLGSAEGKVFLVAGLRHLQEVKNLFSEEESVDEIERGSLKTLYTFLEEHKNIVVLRPKVFPLEEYRALGFVIN